MILYFTGTGNSRYAADMLAGLIDDEVVSINEMISGMNVRPLCSDRPFIVVSPTHCYRLPLKVEEYLRNVEMSGSKKLYFIMTCGAGIGGAGTVNSGLCAEKGMEYMGTHALVMPDNYLVMYAPSDYNAAEKCLKTAKGELRMLAQRIMRGGKLNMRTSPVMGIVSRAGGKIFSNVCISDKKFTVTDKCVSCKTCASVCPLNNISIVDGKPSWNGNCMHCIACISICPTDAIEYGKGTAKRRRYYLYPDGTQKKT